MSKKTRINGKKEESVEDKYVKMSQHEHILALPDTYVDSVKPDNQVMWIFNNSTSKMVRKEIMYIPGLYKIFDEILVNARDHSIVDKTCKNIWTTINKKENTITVYNDGLGIPVELHNKEKIQVPELIFGHLLTSGNYKQKGKTVGGKNGFGAKLANIFSTDFVVETVCTKNKKYFKQHFYNNMYGKDEPEIRPIKANETSYTKITFKPDLTKFSCDELSDDMIALMEKRVYDVAACTGSKVKVKLNNKTINVKDFKEYIDMFYEEDQDHEDSTRSKVIYENVNARWKVGVVYDPSVGFSQISYVNGIATVQGGTHVNHVLNQIINGISNHIKEKHKNVKVKNAHIKDNISVFIDCVIEDPTFSSQTKEVLKSTVAEFGSKCDLSADFIKQLTKTGIVDNVVNFAKLKELAEMKKTDGKKKSSVRGIPKLEDADWAATRKSPETRLILTEGDSAKTFAINGRAVIGTEKYGVFPLKGKMLNVRDATPKQLLNNEEIKNLKQILGLKQGKKYTDTKELRYGGIVILVDQDTDGSHIKGLIINFLHFFWPSLLKLPNFVQCMATPIIKAFKKSDTKKKNPKIFYTLTEYKNWVDDDLKGDTSKWSVKYYKGLGTSTDKEAKEAFNDFEQSLISYVWNMDSDNKNKLIQQNSESDSDNDQSDDSDNDDESDNDSEDSSDKNTSTDSCTNIKNDTCSEAINLAFAKMLSNKRKLWLKGYDKDNIIENSIKTVPVHDFVHRELIHFSNYDNQRSIPSIDGFKPSQKKIIYASLLKKIENTEIKVVQLAGYISDVAEYHHGETSLQGAIVNMAQDYVGSNNLNVLTPNGNFGTRRTGGKDASSARYIFTQLNQLVPYIFRKEDECITKHIIEDGKKVEPELYPTIIPMVLVNGTEGIGTGFSTYVPCYNPLDIIDNIINMLDGKHLKPMMPWYQGFTGEINAVDHNTYESVGKIKILNETTVHVSELPIRIWTQTYKDYLESILTDDPKNPTKKQFVADYKNHSGVNNVDFKITFAKGVLQQLIKSKTLDKTLKLRGTIKTSNMHLYNSKGTITKYDTVEQIFKDFYDFRLEMYYQRKEYYTKLLENQMLIAYYKKKYIEDILNKKIKIERQKKEAIIESLIKLKYPKLSTKINVDEEEKSYDYLTSMLLFSLTEEKIEELQQQYDSKNEELQRYKDLTVAQIWKYELEELLKQYKKWKTGKEESQVNEPTATIKKKKVKGKTIVIK